MKKQIDQTKEEKRLEDFKKIAENWDNLSEYAKGKMDGIISTMATMTEQKAGERWKRKQVNTEGIDEAIEKANRLKELLEEVQTSIDSLSSKNHKENMAVDCAVQHIQALLKQCEENRKADFGEPCSKCSYMPECKCDWLKTLDPLLRHTSENMFVIAKKGQSDK